MRAQPRVSHFIDGAHVYDRAGIVIPVIHPDDGSVISAVHFNTPSVVNAPLSGAAAAPGARDWTRPAERLRLLRRAVDRAIGQLRARACWINARNLTPVEAPFGNVKASGVGRGNSLAAALRNTQVKPVHIDMDKVGVS
ncbi:MAG: hypothetical protein ACRCSU_12855 [Paracoccaceae bacterium]